ncbi:glutamate 5-kinase [Crateriforma spongiae]|uniref:glutamate 5-kinase n=1 Tax=Crateriforma spongiae TaxID=2724528 RepID=UPI0014472CED|nr:glutamate 5-kinase [Crateriforma spongiae]
MDKPSQESSSNADTPDFAVREIPGTEQLLRQAVVENAEAVVVKVGTRVLTRPDGTLDIQRVQRLSSQLCRIADSGRHTIMVSSGAVGAGVAKLKLPGRPKSLGPLQAVAAIGQTDLIRAYEQSFANHGRHAAQVLLTRNDLRRRSGYLHVRNALLGIHDLGAIAIVNENDSVAVAELRTTFGDNDRLAAHVAGLLESALLIILSDIEGLYDGHPDEPDSNPIGLIRRLDDDVLGLASDNTNTVSKGGMRSKLKAAQIAVSHGHPTIIGPGRQDDVLDQIMAGNPVGTLFMPKEKTIRGRRRWIGVAASVIGEISIDAGAARALSERGSSLLAIGITAVKGNFPRGSVVRVVGPDGRTVGRGLSNYRSSEITKIKGHNSDQIGDLLGHRPYECVIHRDNLVVDVVED